MKSAIEVTEANFENEVLNSNLPVLVEFAAGWSLPSMTLNGALEEIASESDCLKIARVKLDHCPNLVCGTASDVFQRCYALSTGRSALESLEGRTKKQFFHNCSRLLPRVRSPIQTSYSAKAKAFVG